MWLTFAAMRSPSNPSTIKAASIVAMKVFDPPLCTWEAAVQVTAATAAQKAALHASNPLTAALSL
ncbi:MAG: hypothetical protein JWN51_324 [Phycisphaerales bacterium]|nr:hypothetical protein [Phycisphaerales bacterium]